MKNTFRWPFRARLHLRICVRIGVRFGGRFGAKGGLQSNLGSIFSEMCLQTVVMGVRLRMTTLSPLAANCARNRTAIRTPIRTRVDGPLQCTSLQDNIFAQDSNMLTFCLQNLCHTLSQLASADLCIYSTINEFGIQDPRPSASACLKLTEGLES
jgi:hypothetical protein